MKQEIGYITSLIGDPVRTKILWTLLDGRAYTATELALCADTSPQNISMHLSKLVQADLLAVESQGRHKYYRFSRPEVAYAIEAIGNLIPDEKHKKITGNTNNAAIKHCRTCYDHLAGKVGVLLTEQLIEQKLIEPEGAVYLVTKKGRSFFSEFNIDTDELKKSRRIFAKPCLDWTERKPHLAGALGAAFLEKMLLSDYFRKTKDSRAIVITAKGREQLYDRFKIQA
ncbi:ArsR/SmtB family transcription factor [Pedobacter caeni]|uniref:Transcriptional regulator, ArsR family n=1 Tax=Pedobacter caeni TaxID=288992 RepID=A0A1M5BSX0_9SPHI|nr:winged helix-turn-helix domain-containing protein [Pedobacter caeni]SHF45633.1 transcriptional regulator, ArsR family [Pedobacter caeni]